MTFKVTIYTKISQIKLLFNESSNFLADKAHLSILKHFKDQYVKNIFKNSIY